MIQDLPATMKAVVLKEPYKIKVEDVPTPKIERETDVIMKVHMAGLCGELYIYTINLNARASSDVSQEVIFTGTVAISLSPTTSWWAMKRLGTSSKWAVT